MNYYGTNLNLISKAVFSPADNKCPEVPLLLHFFLKNFNIFFRTGLIKLISGCRTAKNHGFSAPYALFLQRHCRPFIRCAQLTFCSLNFIVFPLYSFSTFQTFPLTAELFPLFFNHLRATLLIEFQSNSRGVIKKSQNRKKFSNPLTLYPITTYLFFACPS